MDQGGEPGRQGQFQPSRILAEDLAGRPVFLLDEHQELHRQAAGETADLSRAHGQAGKPGQQSRRHLSDRPFRPWIGPPERPLTRPGRRGVRPWYSLDMLDRHIRAGAVAALLTGFLVAPAAAAEPSLVRDFHPGTERLQNYADTYASRLVVDGIYYFPASDPAHGMELWRTDGTPAGTYRVTDICPGPCGAGPFNLQLYQGEIYFSANDGVSGVELWASTGIPGNARRVRDLCPGPCNGHPRSLEVFKGRLLFIASSGPEWQLWSSDGSRRGTVAVRSFCPYEETSDGFAYSCADGLVRLGDVVLFYMNGSYWRTDGTAAGTGPLSDVIPGLPNVYLGVGRLGDSIYFWAEDALWRTDGTAAGTLRLRTAAELGLNPILNVYGDGIAWNGLFFWEVQFGKVLRTDGTPAGTRLITDLPGAPNLIGFAPLADRMLMSFQLPEFLWSTQG